MICSGCSYSFGYSQLCPVLSGILERQFIMFWVNILLWNSKLLHHRQANANLGCLLWSKWMGTLCPGFPLRSLEELWALRGHGSSSPYVDLHIPSLAVVELNRDNKVISVNKTLLWLQEPSCQFIKTLLGEVVVRTSAVQPVRPGVYYVWLASEVGHFIGLLPVGYELTRCS